MYDFGAWVSRPVHQTDRGLVIQDHVPRPQALEIGWAAGQALLELSKQGQARNSRARCEALLLRFCAKAESSITASRGSNIEAHFGSQ